MSRRLARPCAGFLLVASATGAGCSDNDSGDGGNLGGVAGSKLSAGTGGTAANPGGRANAGGPGAPSGMSGTGASETQGGSGNSTAHGGSAGTSGSSGRAASGGSGRGGSPGNGSGAGGRGGANGGAIGSSGSGGTAGASAAPGGGGDEGGDGGGGRPLLVPEQGALVGLYYGDDSIDATAAKLGRNLPLHLIYYAWEDDFTRAETSKDLAAGRVPFVNWELFGGELDDILAGEYDDMIAKRARDTKALGKPLFIDFGAEMNGDWSPWGGAQNGESADSYVAVYRKVHDAFTAAGATNAIWAFCPNVTDEPRTAWNEALDYYPGDDYVDWMCVDGYNWGDTNGGGWQSFEQVFSAIYPKLSSKNKPIVIGEMASAESGGDKAAWIDAMIPALKAKYPRVKALLWFDVDKETDWRVSSSPESEAAFERMVNDPYFNP